MMAIRKERNPSTWSVVEAKARLDDVIGESDTSGPQKLVRNTDELAVVVPPDDWGRDQRRKGTLAEFFHNSPLRGSGIILERHPDTIGDPRDIDF